MNKTSSQKQTESRYSFILKLIWTAAGLITLILSVPVIAAMVEPLLRKRQEVWRSVGNVNDFKIGETILVSFMNASALPWAPMSEKTASWLRRVSSNEFVAYTINCAHLGCPVRWLPDAEIFMCPCHGGVYNKDGSVAAGPPPHNLDRYPVRIMNGNAEIMASPVPITTLF
jgi:quinol---cytochrome c reductase iron-sulfur subunit, bacillus type